MPTLALQRPVQDEGGVLGPDEIAIMTTAFEQIIQDLRLTQRDDPIAEMAAKLVIELVRNGERDPEKLRKHVVGLYRVS